MAAVSGTYGPLYALIVVGVTTLLGSAVVDPPFGGAAGGLTIGILLLLIVAFARKGAVRRPRKASAGGGRANMPRNAPAQVGDPPLDEVINRLVGALSPRQIILFGSHVYGEPTPDSDVDVMLLFDDDQFDRYELSKRGYSALRGINVPVELHFRTFSAFERRASVPASFEEEVRQRGRLAYAAED